MFYPSSKVVLHLVLTQYMYVYIIIYVHIICIIGVSLSEPHTNQYYEKIAILMYVCMYVHVCTVGLVCYVRLNLCDFLVNSIMRFLFM